jgi:selenocysteine lyase/cysteine desulfurase
MNREELRRSFPVTRKWAFLDHAGVSAASGPAAAVWAEFSSDLINNGSTRVGHWIARCETVRRTIAELLNCDPTALAMTKNTTEGICLVAEGIDWAPGDNVVLPADEYPSNQYPWLNLAARGVEVRRVRSPGPGVELAEIRRAIDSRTRLIAMSWVGFASGDRVDLDDLVQLAREAGVWTFVDIIQGFGALPIDLAATPLDFVASGSHKWALGFQGAGFVYVRPELLERLRPTSVGAHSVRGAFDYDVIDMTLWPDARRFEGGTLNFGGIAAWGASLELLARIGIPVVADAIREITGYVRQSAARYGFVVASDPDRWSGIVSLERPGRDSCELVRRAKEAGVAVNYRGGRIRVAPHFYNNTDDIDRFFAAVARGG